MRFYVPGGLGSDQPAVWYEGTNRRYLHADPHGSVIAWSDNSGALGQAYAYGPYGEPQSWSTSGSRFAYTGQIALPEAKLYYYKARIYDPMAGRFLQNDPVGYDGGMNMYEYVDGDPVNGSDPSGLAGGRNDGCGWKCGLNGNTNIIPGFTITASPVVQAILSNDRATITSSIQNNQSRAATIGNGSDSSGSTKPGQSKGKEASATCKALQKDLLSAGQNMVSQGQALYWWGMGSAALGGGVILGGLASKKLALIEGGGITVTVHSIDAVRLWPSSRRFYARFARMNYGDSAFY